MHGWTNVNKLSLCCMVVILCYIFSFRTTLQWRHNGSGCVSNHQRLNCLLNCWFRRRSKKTSKLRVTGLCAGNSPVPDESPHKRASNAEKVSSIWWRHHVHLVAIFVNCTLRDLFTAAQIHAILMRPVAWTSTFEYPNTTKTTTQVKHVLEANMHIFPDRVSSEKLPLGPSLRPRILITSRHRSK